MDLNKKLTELLEQDPLFLTARQIVSHNVEGDAWLIGGSVYRNLAHLCYGVDKPPVDYDFILEGVKPGLSLPHNWKEEKNRYGNSKLVNGDFLIDLVPLSSIHSIKRRRLEPSIENYLTGTPLTVQSIVYNLKTKKITGDIGLNALQSKTVKVNNARELHFATIKKELKAYSWLLEKAEQLEFTPIYPGQVF